VRFGNILWNLLGLGVPLLIAVLTVPGLISRIGSERFGLLALAWGLIGYAGALDLGIGRAVTQRVAALVGSSEESLVPDVLATANRITTVAGCVGMFLILLGALFGAFRAISVEAVSDAELRASMVLLALALPIQAMSATFRGVNEAYLNFRSISILRIALGAANFGAPFLIAAFTTQLHWLIGTLVVSRALAYLAYRELALARVSESLGGRQRGAYRRIHAEVLVGFGGWYTVSSVVSPFLMQADRFFIGTMMSAAAVTLYVLPYEVTVQALVLVGAVTTVAFPAITGLMAQDPRQALATFNTWLLRVAAGMLLAMLALALVMPHLLRLWVGEHVTSDSILVGRVLCAGVFLNALGAMYYALLHACGKTKITALFHLFELPLFLLLLYALIAAYGIVGAAYAWVARVAIDTLLLAFACWRLQENTRAAR
jgi:O-antigen/teichoic acid export membrane protein